MFTKNPHFAVGQTRETRIFLRLGKEDMKRARIYGKSIRAQGCINQQSFYQFINIHQRTKTAAGGLSVRAKYQFINIHQRTKTQR